MRKNPSLDIGLTNSRMCCQDYKTLLSEYKAWGDLTFAYHSKFSLVPSDGPSVKSSFLTLCLYLYILLCLQNFPQMPSFFSTPHTAHLSLIPCLDTLMSWLKIHLLFWGHLVELAFFPSPLVQPSITERLILCFTFLFIFPSIYNGHNFVTTKNSYAEVLTPVLQNGTIFGARAFKKITKLKRLCNRAWNQAGWFPQFHSSFSRLLWLFEVLLYFYTNCEIICSSSVKNSGGSLIRIALNL